jgi:hypothetical protein
MGAKISIYKNFLRPRKAISTKYPNATKNDILSNHLFSSKRRQDCLKMRHNNFDDDQILHVVAQFCKVTEEGPAESLFDIRSRNGLGNVEKGVKSRHT